MRNAAIGLILMLAGLGVLRAEEGKPEVNLVFLGFAGYSELSPSGEVVGRGVEMVERIFAEAGYPIRKSILPAARIWRGLENGSIHAWPGIFNKPGLIEHTIQTERDLGYVGINLYYLPGRAPPVWPDDLRNGSVITITNYTYTEELRNLLADPSRNLAILRSNSHTGAVKMLRQGRGDYLLDYRSQVQSALGSLEMEPLPWVPVVELPMRLLLSRHSGFAEQLKQDLDEAFDRLKARDAQMEVNL